MLYTKYLEIVIVFVNKQKCWKWTKYFRNDSVIQKKNYLDEQLDHSKKWKIDIFFNDEIKQN